MTTKQIGTPGLNKKTSADGSDSRLKRARLLQLFRFHPTVLVCLGAVTGWGYLLILNGAVPPELPSRPYLSLAVTIVAIFPLLVASMQGLMLSLCSLLFAIVSFAFVKEIAMMYLVIAFLSLFVWATIGRRC